MNLDKDGLASLLERLREAKGPDREIDRELQGEPHGTTRWSFIPEYTASIDASLALVERLLPGWKRSLFEKRGGGWIARVSSPRWETFTSGEDDPLPTAPLALLAALLSAIKEVR
jgi:hypothetical protein